MMNLSVEFERVRLAHKLVRAELVAEGAGDGHWPGELSGSPLATAAAISALVVAHRTDRGATLFSSDTNDTPTLLESIVQSDLSELIVESLHWLARAQNDDGGWGDCTRSRSNLAAALLVQAALRLTGVPAKYADLIARAELYVAAQGGAAALRQRFGKEKTWTVPILANCALAGMIPWRQVPTLPFEATYVPRNWYHQLHLPVAGYALPLLLAVGRAKFHHDPPRNPLWRLVRRGALAKSLAVLDEMQSPDGSYLASTPITALVVMSLASSGQQEHRIVERGVEYLLSAVRADSSWGIDAGLSVRTTVCAGKGLAAEHADHRASASLSDDRSDVLRPDWQETAVVDETIANTNGSPRGVASANGAPNREEAQHEALLSWLLDVQQTDTHPVTGAPPGGWAWNDLPAAPPETEATAGALAVLAHWQPHESSAQSERIEQQARDGVEWLLALQNHDGGWPMFCHDWTTHSSDRSAPDLTALALQALRAWQRVWQSTSGGRAPAWQQFVVRRIASACDRSFPFLVSQQRADGSFLSISFGNEHHREELNPVIGTSRVLAACAELDLLETDLARRAARWLLSAQHACGGWGPPRTPLDYSGSFKDGTPNWRANATLAKHCTIEETALAIEALLPWLDADPTFRPPIRSGLKWLVDAVEQDGWRHGAVVGLRFSKLWYHERLYPLALAAGTLARAVRRLAPQPQLAAPVG